LVLDHATRRALFLLLSLGFSHDKRFTDPSAPSDYLFKWTAPLWSFALLAAMFPLVQFIRWLRRDRRRTAGLLHLSAAASLACCLYVIVDAARGGTTFNDFGIPRQGFLHLGRWSGAEINYELEWAGFQFYRYGDDAECLLTLPHWPFIPLALLLPLLWLRRCRILARTADRAKAGHCGNCGYDLRATPDRCPECGRVFAQPTPSTLP
jgi:hypothetical protein